MNRREFIKYILTLTAAALLPNNFEGTVHTEQYITIEELKQGCLDSFLSGEIGIDQYKSVTSLIDALFKPGELISLPDNKQGAQ